MGLEVIQGTSEAGASGSVPKSAAPEATSGIPGSLHSNSVVNIESNSSTSSQPSSSSQPPAPEPTQDNTVLDNLVSHYSGELPEVSPSLQRASEVASEEVASESPQQQAPNLQMASSTSFDQTLPEHVVLEQTVPEQFASEHTFSSIIPEPAAPEQTVPEQTQSSTIPPPEAVFKPTCINQGVSIASSMESDSKDDQVNPQSDTMVVDPNPKRSSSNSPETIIEPENLTTLEATDMEIDQSFSTEVLKTISDQPSTSSTQTPTSTND